MGLTAWERLRIGDSGKDLGSVPILLVRDPGTPVVRGTWCLQSPWAVFCNGDGAGMRMEKGPEAPRVAKIIAGMFRLGDLLQICWERKAALVPAVTLFLPSLGLAVATPRCLPGFGGLQTYREGLCVVPFAPHKPFKAKIKSNRYITSFPLPPPGASQPAPEAGGSFWCLSSCDWRKMVFPGAGRYQHHLNSPFCSFSELRCEFPSTAFASPSAFLYQHREVLRGVFAFSTPSAK